MKYNKTKTNKTKTNKTKTKTKTNKTKTKTNKTKTKKEIFTKKHYSSGDGMLTTIWGPNFNYPITPTLENKKYYKEFILNLQHTLPCKHCRINLKNNLKVHPLKSGDLKDRDSFSRYIYKLHEIVNKMLNKKSGLTYCVVRERYEHFRSRCTTDNTKKKLFKFKKLTQKEKGKGKEKEKGCTEPLYGKKARCILNIVPQENKSKTLKIDNKCIKRR